MIRRLVLDNSSAFQPPADLLPLLSSPHGGPLIRLRVASWSMFPTLQEGDVLEVEEAHDIRPGDIVVFRRNNVLVCHRVTGYGRPGEILTAGDRTREPGEAVPLCDVLAKVHAISRRGKRLVPGRPAEPTVAAQLRLVLDRSLTAWNTAWRHRAEEVWEWLRCSPRGRALLSWLIRRGARVHVIRRTPLHSLGAFSVVRRETIRLDEVERTPLVRVAPAAERVRLEVRLGPYALGACDPASGKIFVQPLVKDLGLEQVLHKLTRRLEAGPSLEKQPIETGLGLQPEDRSGSVIGRLPG
ncbi:MAG: S24/S26 family peptidase [Nitrospirota bacterium]